jgi:DNA polymerase zeta
MEEYGLDTVEYHEPFYSDPADVPPRPKLFAGRAFRVKTNSVAGLPDFEHQVSPGETPKRWLKTRQIKSVRVQHGWEYALPPPSLRRVVAYCEQEDADAEAASAAASQLALPTQKNRYGFKLSQKKPQREQQNMSVLLLEVFAPSRHQLLPDPEKDEMAAVFFCFQNDREDLPDTTRFPGYHAGYVLVDAPPVAARRARLEGVPCHYVEGELDLINWVVDMVKDWDPDVLAGWELHNASWGYLAARAHHAFGE